MQTETVKPTQAYNAISKCSIGTMALGAVAIPIGVIMDHCKHGIADY